MGAMQCQSGKNPVNQRKLHTVHTLIFAKLTKVAHGRTRVNKFLVVYNLAKKLFVNLFALMNLPIKKQTFFSKVF